MILHEWEENHKGIIVCKMCRMVKTYRNALEGCAVHAHMVFDKLDENERRWKRSYSRKIRRFYP